MSEYIRTDDKHQHFQEIHFGFDKKYGRLYAEFYKKGEKEPAQSIGWLNSNGEQNILTVDKLKAEVEKRGWKLESRAYTRLENEQKQYLDGKRIEKDTARNLARTGVYYLEKAETSLKRTFSKVFSAQPQQKQNAATEEKTERKDDVDLSKHSFPERSVPYRVNVQALQGNKTVIPPAPAPEREKDLPEKQQRKIPSLRVIDAQVFDGKVYAAIRLTEEGKTIWFHRDGIENHSTRKVLSDFRSVQNKSELLKEQVKIAKNHSLVEVKQFPGRNDRTLNGVIHSPQTITRNLQGKGRADVAIFQAKHQDFSFQPQKQHVQAATQTKAATLQPEKPHSKHR